MSKHEEVLRSLRELDQRIREVERVIAKIKDPTSLRIDLKDGTTITLSINVLGRSALDHMLQSALSDMKKEQIKIEDRIAKWE
jgi:hypothetical protein